MNSDREDLIDFISYTDSLIQDAIDVLREDIPVTTYTKEGSNWKFFIGTGDHFFSPGIRLSLPQPFTTESEAIRKRISTDKTIKASFPPKILYDWATDGWLDYGKFDTTNDYASSIALGLCNAGRVRFVVRYGTSCVIYQCSESDFEFEPAIAFCQRHHMYLSKEDWYRIFKPAPKIVAQMKTNVLPFKMMNTGY